MDLFNTLSCELRDIVCTVVRGYERRRELLVAGVLYVRTYVQSGLSKTGLSETGLSESLLNPTLCCESQSQPTLCTIHPGLSNTWFIQHLVYPTPGLSNS